MLGRVLATARRGRTILTIRRRPTPFPMIILIATNAAPGRVCRLLLRITVLTIMTFRAAACVAAIAYLPQTGDRSMAQPSPPGRMAVETQAADVVLNCRPDRAGNRLIFPY